MGDVAAYRRGIDQAPGNDDLTLCCIDEALGARVSGMDERAAREVHMLDMRRRVAEIKALELAGVTLTERHKRRIFELKTPRVLDVGDRDDTFGTVRNGIAGDWRTRGRRR